MNHSEGLLEQCEQFIREGTPRPLFMEGDRRFVTSKLRHHGRLLLGRVAALVERQEAVLDDHGPAGCAPPQPEVDVFVVHEKSLVEATEGQEFGSGHKHGSAGNKAAACRSQRSSPQQPQAELVHPRPADPVGGHHGAEAVGQGRPHQRRVGGGEVDRPFQQLGVRIDEQEPVRLGELCQPIAGTSEADVGTGFVNDGDPELDLSLLDGYTGCVVARVVEDKDPFQVPNLHQGRQEAADRPPVPIRDHACIHRGH